MRWRLALIPRWLTVYGISGTTATATAGMAKIVVVTLAAIAKTPAMAKTPTMASTPATPIALGAVMINLRSVCFVAPRDGCHCER